MIKFIAALTAALTLAACSGALQATDPADPAPTSPTPFIAETGRG